MPFDTDILSRTGLANTAYADLTERFPATGHGHKPSPQQWEAIRDLLDHLERAASSGLPPALYVSAIPAGTGKTQSIAAFARALLTHPNHNETGMLILVNRIAEAADMATVLRDHQTKLCIYTSDPAVSGLGEHAEANEAQVCIATQAALKATLKTLQGAPFATASRFHYRGSRRAVICWDESFAFNRPVTLDADAVVGLARAMRRQSEDAANMLKRWSSELDGHPGGLCSVPDFEGLGVDFRRLEDDVGDQDALVAQAKALAAVSGDEGYVTRQGSASVMITHYPEIPRNLMPVVVTDASAKINPSYTQMAQKVPFVWLKDASKTYHNMTIRIVPTAASRSVYRDAKTYRGRDLINMAVRYVQSVPGEAVLIVGYKGQFAMRGVEQKTLEEAIRARLTREDQTRIHYLAYGRHTATNEFKHCKHVLLMGLNFLPRAASHAASGAALNLDLKGEQPTDIQISDMRQGMLMDATLQALLRGHARIAIGEDCGQMEAIIPQTKQTGLSAKEYRAMFPGVQIIYDTTLMPAKPLSGRLQALSAIVTRRLAAGETEMTNPSLYGELGTDRRNFAKLIKRQEWQAYIAQVGLNPQPLRGGIMGLRRGA